MDEELSTDRVVMVELLIDLWALVSERGMQPAPIVPCLDVVEHVRARFGTTAIRTMIYQLALQCCEEALCGAFRTIGGMQISLPASKPVLSLRISNVASVEWVASNCTVEQGNSARALSYQRRHLQLYRLRREVASLLPAAY